MPLRRGRQKDPEPDTVAEGDPDPETPVGQGAGYGGEAAEFLSGFVGEFRTAAPKALKEQGITLGSTEDQAMQAILDLATIMAPHAWADYLSRKKDDD